MADKKDAGAPQEKKLDQETIESTLRTQVEFYFSKENISNDAFLVSQMNKDKQVPVSVIARFNKVQKLLAQCEDKEMLVKVMRSCKNCIVDAKGEMVKPKLKTERNTLILREISQSTDKELVKGIFDHPECGKVVDIRSDIGDTWFVVFESEAKCMDTAMFLMGKKFQGKPIKCRVKQESMLRGFYMHQGQGQRDGWRQSGANNYQYASAPVYYNQQFVVQYPNQQNQGGQQQQQQQQQQASKAAANSDGWQTAGSGRGNKGKQADKKGRKNKEESPRNNNTRNAKASKAPAKEDKKGKKGDKTDKKEGKKGKKAAEKQVEFTNDDFPHLTGEGEVNAVPVGYAGKFKSYSREKLAEVVAQLTKKGFNRPSTFPTEKPGDETDPGHVIRKKPVQECQLLEPFPVMFPASPSPVLAAQPRATNMPALDLNSKKKKKRNGSSAGRRKPRNSVNEGKPKYAQKTRKKRNGSSAARAKPAPKKEAAAPAKEPTGYAAAAAKSASAPKKKAAQATKPEKKEAAKKSEPKKAEPVKNEPTKAVEPAKESAAPAAETGGKPSFADLLKRN